MPGEVSLFLLPLPKRLLQTQAARLGEHLI